MLALELLIHRGEILRHYDRFYLFIYLFFFFFLSEGRAGYVEFLR